MGHAHLDLFNALGRTGFEDRVENDHRALATLVGEALFPEKPLADEVLERLGLEHPAQRVQFLRRSFIPADGMHLDPLAHPVADGRVVDVHELEADLPRVGGLQRRNHVADLHLVPMAKK